MKRTPLTPQQVFHNHGLTDNHIPFYSQGMGEGDFFAAKEAIDGKTDIIIYKGDNPVMRVNKHAEATRYELLEMLIDKESNSDSVAA